jgi:STE24 endopeptidase
MSSLRCANSSHASASRPRRDGWLWIVIPAGILVAFFLVVLAASLVLPLPPGAEPPAYFSPAELSRGEARASLYRLLFFVRTVLTVVFLGGLLAFRADRPLRAASLFLARGRPLPAVFAFAALFVGLSFAVFLPLDFLSGYVLPHRFGLATAGPGRWLADAALTLGVYGGLRAALGGAVVLLIRKLGRRFWIWLWIGVAVLGFAIVFLKPVALDPLFNDFRPLPSGGLRERIMALAREAGETVGEIYVVDASRRTRGLNAYFTGIGSTSRIVLYDNLLRDATEREVLAVVAHEAGHRRHRHIHKGFLLFLGGAGLFLWIFARVLTGLARRGVLDAPGDLRAIFVLSLLVFLALQIGRPVEGAISRAFERQADAEELRLARDPGAFREAMVRLVRTNVSDPDPPAFYYWLGRSHPTAVMRLRFAEVWEENARKGKGRPSGRASGRPRGGR